VERNTGQRQPKYHTGRWYHHNLPSSDGIYILQRNERENEVSVWDNEAHSRGLIKPDLLEKCPFVSTRTSDLNRWMKVVELVISMLFRMEYFHLYQKFTSCISWIVLVWLRTFSSTCCGVEWGYILAAEILENQRQTRSTSNWSLRTGFRKEEKKNNLYTRGFH
jgi:hypothetical protein